MKADTPDEFAILTATWILASNDENPLMTYKSVIYRLDLPENYELKKLINSRGELFRRGVRSQRLEDWKFKMISNSSSRPSWMRALGDEAQQKAAINALTPDDIFRSQFRATKDSEKSPIEIIDWGLQHIERLRKASIESRDQYAKSTEVRWVLVVSMLSAIISALSLFTK